MKRLKDIALIPDGQRKQEAYDQWFTDRGLKNCLARLPMMRYIEQLEQKIEDLQLEAIEES